MLTAQTGTGKTLAYLAPILEWILQARDPAAVRALVIVPTRELAVQVTHMAVDLTRTLRRKKGVWVWCVTEKPWAGCTQSQIVVATPVLVRELWDTISYPDLSLVVLDEVGPPLHCVMLCFLVFTCAGLGWFGLWHGAAFFMAVFLKMFLFLLILHWFHVHLGVPVMLNLCALCYTITTFGIWSKAHASCSSSVAAFLHRLASRVHCVHASSDTL